MRACAASSVARATTRWAASNASGALLISHTRLRHSDCGPPPSLRITYGTRSRSSARTAFCSNRLALSATYAAFAAAASAASSSLMRNATASAIDGEWAKALGWAASTCANSVSPGAAKMAAYRSLTGGTATPFRV